MAANPPKHYAMTAELRPELETYRDIGLRWGKSHSTICEWVKNDPTWPPKIPMGPHTNPWSSVAFESKALDAWLAARKALPKPKR